MTNIAVIPARGGSKRVPRKNIKEFQGKPMIAYAINGAKESGLFDHIIVSTDDEEIAEISLSLGAQIPFLRPTALANDYIPTAPVIVHAIESCLSLGFNFEHVCCIYPAVPLMQSDDLVGALQILDDNPKKFSFPVAKFPSPIQSALKVGKQREIELFFPENELSRTQDLESAYFDAGQFYWGRATTWLMNLNIHSNGLGYEIPSWRVMDIDTPQDWEHAELLYRTIYL